MSVRSTFRPSRVVAGAFSAVLVLAGCAAGSTPATTAASSSTASVPLTLSDGYVKAASKSGHMAMSAIFGELKNSSSSTVTVVSGTSDAAMTIELHEMVMKDGKMEMQPKQGGFAVPANGSLELGPGGLHIMLIGLTRDIKAGESLSAELTLSDGQKVTVSAVGRDLPNANESYAPNPEPSHSHG